MSMNSRFFSNPISLRRAVLALALITAPAALDATAASAQDQPPPIVRVADVSVQGLNADNGVLVFKGIPYAADTGGANRFRAPQPLTGWSGAFNAENYGPTCPGLGGLPPPGFADAPEGNDVNLTPPSEDCLRLNVWTPAADGKRPVIAYLHGGGFVTGTGNISWYDGTNIARRGDVVFVTINYRLNVFGFLDLAAVDPSYAADANAGLQDIVAALRWVKANIAQFGGNPDNVTLMGQSAGADAALALMAVPSATGLFHKVIAQSGYGGEPVAAEQAAGQAKAVLATLGVGDDLKGLADLPWDKLLSAFAGNSPWVDGTFLPAGFDFPSAPSQSPAVPLLIGWNATESTFFEGPTPIADDKALRAALKEKLKLEMFARSVTNSYLQDYPNATPNDLYVRIIADLDFAKTALTIANQKSGLGKAPVYVYRFDARTEVGGLGTPHGLEIGYALDNLERTRALTGEVTAAKQEIADIVSDAWISFARSGVPTGRTLPHWGIYEAKGPVVDVEHHPNQIMSLDQTPMLITVPGRTKALTGQ